MQREVRHRFPCPFCGGAMLAVDRVPGCADDGGGATESVCYLHAVVARCVGVPLRHRVVLVAALSRGRTPRRGGFSGAPA